MNGSDHDRALEYVDGELSPTERAAFERRLTESAELRAIVVRARVVRGLLSGLPRRGAPELSFDSIFERTRVHELPALRRLFSTLPRRLAPESIFSLALLRFRADRRRRAATAVVRQMPRVRRVAQLAAAAALVLCTWSIFAAAPRDVRPQGDAGVRFDFRIVRVRPGAGGPESATHIWPPSFLSPGTSGSTKDGGGR